MSQFLLTKDCMWFVRYCGCGLDDPPGGASGWVKFLGRIEVGAIIGEKNLLSLGIAVLKNDSKSYL